MPAIIDTDFYQVLNVSRFASMAEIEKAARKLLNIHHPEKYGGAQNQAAHSQFCARVTQARNALVNKTTRIAHNKALQDAEILICHEPPPVVPLPKFPSEPSKPAQEKIPLRKHPPKTLESRPRFGFTTIPTTSSSPFGPSPQSLTTSNSSNSVFKPEHARERFSNAEPSNSQEHLNPQESTGAQGLNREHAKDDKSEDSNVLEPGQDSDNEGNRAPKSKPSRVENGIPFAEWLKDPVGSRRLIYGSFSSNLVCSRKLGKFDFNGKEVSHPSSRSDRVRRVPYSECRLLRGWECLTALENEKKIFEKLKEKYQTGFTTFEDLLERRQLVNCRRASTAKATKQAKRKSYEDDEDDEDSDEDWSGAKKQKLS